MSESTKDEAKLARLTAANAALVEERDAIWKMLENAAWHYVEILGDYECIYCKESARSAREHRPDCVMVTRAIPKDRCPATAIAPRATTENTAEQ